MKIKLITKTTLIVVLLGLFYTPVRAFVHPGCNQSQSDLDRIKAKVLAGEHPWIDGWNKMIVEGDAQYTYTANPKSDIGGTDGTRQRSQRDANAAFWNILRWYVTGNTSYADCAVRILNAYSDSIKTSTGQLYMLPIWGMVQAGELLRMYPGWSSADFERFKNMCLNIFYPACRDFRHREGSWPSWDGPANVCCLEIAVLCDDTTKFNDAIEYYKNGEGGGCVTKAILPNGEITEMGRDIPHAEIGPGAFTDCCAIAWNQGIDLFGYADNRLLAGYEYFNKYNLVHGADNWVTALPGMQNFYFPSKKGAYRIFGNELIYNHYVIRKGLSAPYTRNMVGLNGIGILSGTLYTYSDTTTIFAAKPMPGTPASLTAKAGVSRVELKWTAPPGDVVRGYTVWRSTQQGGPYTQLASWNSNMEPQYVDFSVKADTTYYYAVSALNNTGSSAKSAEASATPVSFGSVLKTGWSREDINTPTLPSSASYSPINNNTFSLASTGSDIWGNDRFGYLCSSATGNCTITARIYEAIQDPNMIKAKIGLMMRETLDPNSKNATIHFGGVETRCAAMSFRTTNNGGTGYTPGNQHSWVPTWVRLQRSGNTFTAYQSDDSITWIAVGSIDIAMASTYKVGMFVCGTGDLYTCKFDQVAISGGGSVPVAPTTFTGTSVSSTRLKLSWAASATASTYDIKRSTSLNGVYATVKTGVSATTFEDSGLNPNTTYYYSIKSANVAGSSADSIRASATTKVLSLPPAPAGLTATPNNQSATLTWTATEELTSSYKIKRSIVNGGPYTVVGTSTTASYVDNTPSNDTTYYYVVSAVNSMGEGANSSAIGCMPVIGQHRYFPFDATADTVATCALTGEQAGLMTGATFVPGKIYNGLYLDGTSNAYSTSPTGIVSSLKDFTIATWVKLDALSTWARIFDFGTGTTNYMFLTPKSSNGYPCYSITIGGGEQKINCTTAIPTGTWAHIAVTLKDTVGIMYVNGVEVGRNNSMKLTPSSLGSTTKNYIGKSQWNDPYLKGTVDEFRIYKEALTSDQISKLMNVSTQTVTFNSIPAKTVADADFSPGATATSGLEVAYSSSDASVATVVNNKVRIAGVGSCTIYANQSGSVSYAAAQKASQTLTVATAPLTGQHRYWTFDKTSGSIDTCAWSGAQASLMTADSTTWVSGKFNNAVHFNGTSSSYATLPDGILSAVNDFTISAWVKLDALDTWARIFDFGTGTTNYMFLAPKSSNGCLRYEITKGSGAQQINSTAAIPAGTWKHIAITLKDTVGIMYVDGVEVGRNNSMKITPSALGATTKNYLGKSQWNDPYLKGAIDEFKIFNQALTPAQISQLKNLSAQSITFNALSDKFVGDADFSAGAAASSGLAVTYASSDTTVAKIVNGQVHIAGVGTAVISAKQVGDELYSAALKVSQALNVSKRSQTITFNAISDKLVGDADFSAGATASSGLAVTYASSDTTVAKIVNGQVHIVAAGSTVISADQLGNELYSAALKVSQALNVSKRSQTITFNAISDKLVGDADFSAGATASSGLAVTYASSDTTVAKIVNGNVHIVAAGTATITASQSGNSTYSAATDVAQTLIVSYNPSSACRYRYFPFDETSGTAASCVWTGAQATLMTSGSTWASANFNNGVHFDGVSSAYATLPSGFVSSLTDFTISTWVKLDAMSSWARIFDFGTGTANYMFLTPKSSSGYLRYAITTSGGSGEQQINTTTLLPTNTWTHVAVTLKGTVGILYVNGVEVGRNSSMSLNPSSLGATTQNYLGKSQWNDPYLMGTIDELRIYNQALSANQITELKNVVAQSVTFNALSAKTVGDADFSAGATASSGLPVTYTSSNPSVATIVNGNIHVVGAGSATISANQSGNESYAAAQQVSQSLTVNKVSQTITFSALPLKVVGDADFYAGATASSGLTVTYASSDTTVAKIVSGNIHIVAAGTSMITASQAGDATYNAASDVSQTLTVNLDGTFSIIASHSGNAMDVSGGSLLDGASVLQWTYSGATNQQWVITRLSGSDYKIISVRSGKALDVVKNSTSNGAKIEQRTYSSSDNSQIWTITYNGDGTYRIIGKASGKALGVAGASTANGALFELRTYTGGGNQKYNLTLLSPLKRASKTTDVPAQEVNPDVLCYPNPVKDNFTVKALQGGKVELYSALGALIAAKTLQEGITNFNIGNFPAGAYIVKVYSANNTVAKKIFKE